MMKIGNVTNQLVTKDFFEAIFEIIAENTSFSYSNLAINNIKNQLSREFKFLKNVSIKNRAIAVRTGINSVEKGELRKFFIKAINIIGPNYLKVLLSKKLYRDDLSYLEGIGIKFG